MQSVHHSTPWVILMFSSNTAINDRGIYFLNLLTWLIPTFFYAVITILKHSFFFAFYYRNFQNYTTEGK